MGGGDTVVDKAPGSGTQYGEDDAADLVRQGRSESEETRRVDGGFRLRPAGFGGETDGGRLVVMREWGWRPRPNCGGDRSNSCEQRNPRAREQMGEGE